MTLKQSLIFYSTGFILLCSIVFLTWYFYLEDREAQIASAKIEALEAMEAAIQPETALEVANRDGSRVINEGLSSTGIPVKTYSEEERAQLVTNGLHIAALEGTQSLDALVAADYKKRLLQLFYANNYRDGQILINQLFEQYDLNTFDDEAFKQLVLDLNVYFQQHLYETKIISLSQFSSPEVIAYLFIQADLGVQTQLITEKQSPIITQVDKPQIVAVSEVSPTKHHADKYFLGVSRGICYEVLVQTETGTTYLYLYKDEDGTMHVLSTEIKDAQPYTTYATLSALYEGGYN